MKVREGATARGGSPTDKREQFIEQKKTQANAFGNESTEKDEKATKKK